MTNAQRSLNVFFGHELCGVITEENSLSYTFTYTHEWVSAKKPAISLSLPIQEKTHSQLLSRAYFGGLLPEGNARRQIASQLQIDELDDIALLSVLGRECAGALTIVDQTVTYPKDLDVNSSEDVEWIDTNNLKTLIHSLRVDSNLAPLERYSISLAGAQLKRGVIILDNKPSVIGIPLGNTLSTHILKIEPSTYPGMTAVEHAMQALASDIGLRASKTSIRKIEDEQFLLVERYDRKAADSGGFTRIHQEDFCQALGRTSTQKYERFVNGKTQGPAALDVTTLIRASARPSIQQVDDFLRIFWFNVIIGNVDAHAKNYSILYDVNLEKFSIAPLYDAICVTAFHADKPFTQRKNEEPLSMNIGGQTRFWQLSLSDIERFAKIQRVPPNFVLRQLRKLVNQIQDQIDSRIDINLSEANSTHPILETVRKEIHHRCEFMLSVLE